MMRLWRKPKQLPKQLLVLQEVERCLLDQSWLCLGSCLEVLTSHHSIRDTVGSINPLMFERTTAKARTPIMIVPTTAIATP